MAWEIFEPVASTYEAWYATRKGRRVDRAERALLDWLLSALPNVATVLEVGCGTGHFTRHLAARSRWVVGLDRSPQMLAALRAIPPPIPGVLGDADHLPFRDRSVDVVVLVIALEFLEDPARSLAEAVRVARRRLILLVLNRWSLGGLSRRVGPQSRQPLLSHAQDYSLFAIRSLLRHAAADRLDAVHWTSILFPGFPLPFRLSIPFGDVIGVRAVLGQKAQ